MNFFEFSIEEDLYTNYDTSNIFLNNFNIVITTLHSYLPQISCVFLVFFDENRDENITDIRGTAYSINQICKKFGIDLVNAIEIKHNYNINRSYKHGGKKF